MPFKDKEKYQQWLERTREYNNKRKRAANRQCYYNHHEQRLERAKNRVTFNGKRINMKQQLRTGTCFLCKAENVTTHVHHFEYDIDPLKYTIEICNKCHRGLHNRYGSYKKEIKTQTNI